MADLRQRVATLSWRGAIIIVSAAVIIGALIFALLT